MSAVLSDDRFDDTKPVQAPAPREYPTLKPEQPPAAGNARIAVRSKVSIGDRAFEPGDVIELDADVARLLVHRGQADDHPSAIARAFEEAKRDEKFAQRELDSRASWSTVTWVWPDARRRRKKAQDRQLVHPIAVPAALRREAAALPPAETIALTPVDQHGAFAEEMQNLRTLQRDLEAVEDRIAEEQQKGRSLSPAKPVDLVRVALNNEKLTTVDDTIRQRGELLSTLEQRAILLRSAIELQQVKVERARQSAAVAVAAAECRTEQLTIARKIFEAVRALQEAEQAEASLETAMCRAGYGAMSLQPRLSVIARAPFDLTDLLTEYARDAQAFIEKAESRASTSKRG